LVLFIYHGLKYVVYEYRYAQSGNEYGFENRNEYGFENRNEYGFEKYIMVTEYILDAPNG